MGFVSSGLSEDERYLVFAGVVLGFLGLLAVLTPFLTGLSISIVFGVILVLGGFARFASALQIEAWKGVVWEFVLSGIYVLAGLSLIFNPFLGLTSLTVILIVYLFVEGIFQVYSSLWVGSGVVWLGINGFLSIILSFLIFIGFPSTAAWALGLLLGINLISTGVALILLGYSAGKQ